MDYRIIVNNLYEITKEEFSIWSGLSYYVIDCLARQNVFQHMPNGDIITFKK